MGGGISNMLVILYVMSVQYVADIKRMTINVDNVQGKAEMVTGNLMFGPVLGVPLHNVAFTTQQTSVSSQIDLRQCCTVFLRTECNHHVNCGLSVGRNSQHDLYFRQVCRWSLRRRVIVSTGPVHRPRCAWQSAATYRQTAVPVVAQITHRLCVCSVGSVKCIGMFLPYVTAQTKERPSRLPGLDIAHVHTETGRR
jgi:hypothetical protein